MTALSILLIEDDELVREAIRRVLAREGCKVEAVASARKGLETLSERPVDIVVTDLIMPDMDGLAVIAALRTAWPEVGILAISGGDGLDGGDLLASALVRGAHAILRKPFRKAELLEALDRVRERRLP